MRMPKGLHKQADDSVVCSHRDVSCCPECLAAHEQLVDVVGAVYWIDDKDERDEMVRDCANLVAFWNGERDEDGQ